MLTDSATNLNIPDGTIALTYDDGPGGHTIDIAKFLAEMNVRALSFSSDGLSSTSPRQWRNWLIWDTEWETIRSVIRI